MEVIDDVPQISEILFEKSILFEMA